MVILESKQQYAQLRDRTLPGVLLLRWLRCKTYRPVDQPADPHGVPADDPSATVRRSHDRPQGSSHTDKLNHWRVDPFAHPTACQHAVFPVGKRPSLLASLSMQPLDRFPCRMLRTSACARLRPSSVFLWRRLASQLTRGCSTGVRTAISGFFSMDQRKLQLCGMLVIRRRVAMSRNEAFFHFLERVHGSPQHQALSVLIERLLIAHLVAGQLADAI